MCPQDLTGGFLGPGPDLSANTATYQGSVIGAPIVQSITASNEGTVGIWLMMFDSSVTPVNGATPNVGIPVPIPGGSTIASWDFTPKRQIVNNFYWFASSTQPTLTIATGAALNVDVGL